MSLESVLYTRLSGYAGLTALVSTRIYPKQLPDDVAYPAVSYRRIGGQPIPAGGSDPDLKIYQVEVNCWDQDTDPKETAAYRSMATIAAQVLAALRRWSSAANNVQQVFVTNEGIDLVEPEVRVHHRVLEFQVWYSGS